MILVDHRAGSKELHGPLVRLGLPATLTELPFGDVAFQGRGEAEAVVEIGIEFKRVEELVTSIRDGRFSGHQLPGMVRLFQRRWLLYEGKWRRGSEGELLLYGRRGWAPARGGMPASELTKHLLTYENCGGFLVEHTLTRRDTLYFVGDLYRWWTDRALDAHTSHLTPHQPHPFLAVSAFRQAVMAFPGVGLKTSLAIETHFQRSLRRATTAPVAEWAEIVTLDKQQKPRRLGRKVAQDIVAFCEGRA